MDISLNSIEQDIVERLQTGASRRKSAIHTPVVGTADGDLRVMVLREFDSARFTLRFHTDSRSPKVAAINNNTQMSVLAYDPEGKVQIRMRGKGKVEQNGPLVDSAWAGSTPFAKRCYLAENPPSDSVDRQTSGLPDWVEGITPTDTQVAPGRENFAIVLIEVTEFDWLYLANSGHRRARFLVSEERDSLNGCWLVP